MFPSHVSALLMICVNVERHGHLAPTVYYYNSVRGAEGT